MKRKFTSLMLFVAMSTSLFAQVKEKKVLFIGIDGLRSDALQKANTPNMDQLMKEGTYTFTSWHLGITSSGPSWSDMLTGVWETKHGVKSNNYTGSKFNDYPYFPKRAKEINPNLKCVQVTSWSPMSDKVYNDGWDSKMIPPTDDGCTAVAKTQLLDPDLDILFVHLDDVDAAGHSNGFSPNVTPYMNMIEYKDKQVGQIINALKSRNNFNKEDWLVLLTTDHGGIGLGHGGNSVEEKHIWWIAWGPSVAKKHIVADISGGQSGDYSKVPLLVDIAVTALDHVLPNTDPTKQTAWKLDGKSWLSEIKTSTVDHASEYVADNGFRAFPVPSYETVELLITKDVSAFEYSIVDISGRVQQTAKVGARRVGESVKLNTQGLAKGIYFVKVNAGSKTALQKIILK